MPQIQCRLCGEFHEATKRNFPLTFIDRIAPYKTKKGMTEYQPGVIGYGCRKCDQKNTRQHFINMLKIKPNPEKRINQQLREAINEGRLEKEKEQCEKVSQSLDLKKQDSTRSTTSLLKRGVKFFTTLLNIRKTQSR